MATTHLRRTLAAVAATGLLAGIVPGVAAAATPEKRDITDFACPAGEVPDPKFTDDDDTTAEHRASIWCVVWYELASGRTSTTYAPHDPVNRGQMATFLANLVTAGGVALPSNPPDAFSDDDGTTHEKAINQLAAVGVVNGTGADTYEPHATVSREQMATFLNNAYEEITGSPLDSTEDFFTDDDGRFHEDNINAVAAAGIAAGKTATTYAPTEPVYRDQMATFLARETDLLVEEGDIDKPVTQDADVKLASSSVAQGGKVSGTIATQDGVTVTGAKVSGCGITDQELDLSGTTNAFEFTIPVTQPTGDCTLTFTVDIEDGDSVTDEEALTVTAGTSNTAAPELLKVDQASSSDTTVTLRYTFDESLRQVSLTAADFRIYDASANQTEADTASVNGATVLATFPKDDLADATTAAVTANAVEDLQSVANPEGAAPLAQESTTVTGTTAPDLKLVTQTGNEWLFTFDESVVAHPGDEGNYHLVLDDGNVLDGTALTEQTGDETVQVTFAAIEATRDVVRAYVDADTVAGSAQDGNPLNGVEDGNPTHAFDEGGDVDGGGDSPYLVSATIDATNNKVIYTFNRSVTLISKGALDSSVFLAYDLSGNEVGTNSATASGSTVTATFSGSTDPITGSTVGASVLTDAVRAATGTRLPNEVDEVLVKESTTISGARGGETAAPDLRSVTRSIDGDDSVLTFTFDQAVAAGGTTSPTTGDLVIYQQDGSRTELDLNDSSGNECTRDGNTVVCRAVSTSTLGQLIDSAVLGGVEYDAVAGTATSSPRNYEASSAIA